MQVWVVVSHSTSSLQSHFLRKKNKEKNKSENKIKALSKLSNTKANDKRGIIDQ